MKDLFGHEPQPPPRKAFDGKTYEPVRDYVRLTGQLERVFGNHERRPLAFIRRNNKADRQR